MQNKLTLLEILKDLLSRTNHKQYVADNIKTVEEEMNQGEHGELIEQPSHAG